MKVIFLTLVNVKESSSHSLYQDLLREFYKNVHDIYIVSPSTSGKTEVIHTEMAEILRVHTGTIQKTKNYIKKGIATVLLEPQYIFAIKKYFSNVQFDLILYSTPPITLSGVASYIKKRDHAHTYLLLKDIWPQGVVDLGALKKTGILGLAWRYFRYKERELYKLSDYIGCMSQANVEYLHRHEPWINHSRIEVCPNSCEPVDQSVDQQTRNRLRKQYGLPLDKVIFVYGGNLGVPQGIDFFIECLKSAEQLGDCFFLIVGDGTEFSKIEHYVQSESPSHIKLLRKLPKKEYDQLVGSCDVGMIYLNASLTVPNIPSRLLSYMEARIPVLAATDHATDLKEIIRDGGFGWHSYAGDLDAFCQNMASACAASSEERQAMGQRGWDYLLAHYTAAESYDIIMRHMV